MPNPYAACLTIEWTLPILARRPGEAPNSPTGFVHEFDCELTVNYWREGNDYDYELDYVAIEHGRDRFIVTRETDRDLYAILLRGFKAETRTTKDTLHQRIIERCQQLSDESRYFPREAAE